MGSCGLLVSEWPWTPGSHSSAPASVSSHWHTTPGAYNEPLKMVNHLESRKYNLILNNSVINPIQFKAIRRAVKGKRAWGLDFYLLIFHFLKFFWLSINFQRPFWVSLNFINMTISLQFTSCLLLEMLALRKIKAILAVLE